MASRKNTASDVPADPVTAWAKDVVAKRIVAGPDVRAACKRHLDDLKNAGKRGYYWDLPAAMKAIEFFPDLLMIEGENGLEPFHLMGWQLFAVGSIFGWKRTDTGFRRFTIAYIECAKGAGKTPLAAGIGLYMMVADGELAAEVYAAARNKDQARIAFDDAVKFVDASPYLHSRIRQSGVQPVWQLSHLPSMSKFRPIASGKSKSGPRVHCAIIDELHEHKDGYVLEMMKAGTKKRNQPLIFIITNSGFDRKSICYQYHTDALKIVHRLRENDQFFSMVFSLDPGDDPLEDESCWPKTNPGIGRTVKLEYLRERVADARAIPGQQGLTLRLNFCVWTDADTPWMTRQAWTDIEEDMVQFEKGAAVKANPFDGAVCGIGLDLSFRFDLTALAFAFPEKDNRISAWIEYFTPEETALEREKKDGTPYTEWIRRGLIHAVPGKVVRKEYIGARILEVLQQYDVETAAYDRYAHKALADEMAEQGVVAPWMEHPQGFRRGGVWVDPRTGQPVLDPETQKPLDNPLWMPESVMELEARIIEKTIAVQLSPVTRWQVASTVIRNDPAGTGNRVFDKNRALGRIDGIVALAMAVGAVMMRRPEKPDISAFIRNPVRA